MKLLKSMIAIGTFLSASALAHPVQQAQGSQTNAPTTTQVATPDKIVLIQAGWLLAVPGKTPLRERTLVIRNDRIERIDAGYTGPSSFEGNDVEVINLQDRYVLPGLMDMHVHLSDAAGDDKPFKVNNVSGNLDADVVKSRDDITHFVDAVGNAHKTLMAGFTTVRDVGSSGWNMVVLRDAIASGKFEGPRILAALEIIRPGSDNGPGACSGVESCRRETRKQIDMGADLIKIYATCSGSKPCGLQYAPSTFLKDELEAIIDTAHSRQLSVAAHAHGEEGIRAALRAGVNSIEHGSYSPADSIPLYKKNGAFLVPTMMVEGNIRKDIVGATGPMRAVMQNFLDKHGPRMMEAWRSGVTIAAGTDAGVVEHGNNARELQYYVELGMPAAEAIKTATINGAALINRQNDLGTLEVGKIADVIAVDNDPLADIKALQQVRFVMKDGHVFRNDHVASAQ